MASVPINMDAITPSPAPIALSSGSSLEKVPFLPDAALQQLTPEQRDQLKAHHDTVLRQKAALDTLLQKQLELTGRHALLEETEHDAAAHSTEQKSQKGAVAPEPAPVDVVASSVPASLPGSTETSPAGKVSRLTQEAEQVLLSFFSVQDTVTREASLYLSQQAGCSDAQVREYFARLRSSVRTFIQRFQRKTLGIAVGSHAAPAAPGIPSGAQGQPPASTAAEGASAAAEEESPGILEAVKAEMERTDALRNDGLQKLQGFLDEAGGLARLPSAEAMAGLMRSSSAQSWSVKEACLQAIQHTGSTATLRALANQGNLLDILATWTTAAEQDDQISFLRILLSALWQLPLTPQDLRYSLLPKALLQLQKHRLPELVDLAKAVLQQWRVLDGSPSGVSAPAGAALDPSKMAVPLRRPGLSARKPTGSPALPRKAEGKRPRSADDLPCSKTAAHRGSKPSASRNPAKVARLDASTLGNIKGPARHVHAPNSRSNQDGRVLSPAEQIQRATARYQESATRLQAAQERQQHEEARRSAEAAQHVSQAAFVAKVPPIFPPLEMHVAPAFNVGAVGQGEESYEAQVQASRVLNEAEATYLMPELIPNSPAEPWEPPPASQGDMLIIPVTATDANEAREQDQIMRTKGVKLAHLLIAAPAGGPIAGAHGQQQWQQAVPGVFYASQAFQAGQPSFY